MNARQESVAEFEVYRGIGHCAGRRSGRGGGYPACEPGTSLRSAGALAGVGQAGRSAPL